MKGWRMKIMQWLLAGFMLIVLTACGGGGTKQNTLNHKKNNVKVNLEQLNIDTNNLIVSNGSVSKPFSKNLDLNISKEDKGAIGLFNKENKPLLLGRKIAGEENIEISLESSAEIFVLFHPMFNGMESSNPKELSKRIRSHKKFPDLVSQLKYEIENKNPCPLDPICSPKARDIAIEIAEDLNITDLYN